MTLKEYQTLSQNYDVTKGTPNHQLHAIFGLVEEVGEILALFKRKARGDLAEGEGKKLKAELGDALWYLAAIASSQGISLEEVAHANLDKLADRASRKQILGQGDNR